MSTDVDTTEDDDPYPDDATFTRAMMKVLAPTIDEVFADFAIRTLRQVLDDGDLGVAASREDLEGYCVHAAFAWGDIDLDAATGLENVREKMMGMYARFFHAALVGGSENATEVDGQPAVIAPSGEPVVITPGVLRHWQWMWSILSDEMTARRFLLAAPEDLRQLARSRVAEKATA